MQAAYTPGLMAQYFEADDLDTLQGKFDVVTEPGGQRRFWFVCPGRCKALAPLALRPVADGSAQSWEWNGNVEAPTLQPSINHVGCWHGWLTAGVFTPC